MPPALTGAVLGVTADERGLAMTRSQMGDTLLTVAEAAVILGVSTRTVERLRKAGDLRHITVGSGPRPRIFYSQLDVLVLLDDRVRDDDHRAGADKDPASS